MAPLKVYFDLGSQPSRSVLLLLKANKVPFVPEVLKIIDGDLLKNEEFGEVNPSRKVPAIKDGEMKLFECTAIMRYICAKYKLPDHWYPINIEKRAKVDEYLSWHHTNTRLASMDIYRGELLWPRLLGKPIDKKRVARGKKQMANCMEIYDNHFLKNTPFLSSEEISIADLLAVCEFSQLDLMEPNSVKLSQKVKEWKDRCIEHFGDNYHDVHSIIYKLKKVFSRDSKL